MLFLQQEKFLYFLVLSLQFYFPIEPLYAKLWHNSLYLFNNMINSPVYGGGSIRKATLLLTTTIRQLTTLKSGKPVMLFIFDSY